MKRYFLAVLVVVMTAATAAWAQEVPDRVLLIGHWSPLSVNLVGFTLENEGHIIFDYLDQNRSSPSERQESEANSFWTFAQRTGDIQLGGRRESFGGRVWKSDHLYMILSTVFGVVWFAKDGA